MRNQKLQSSTMIRFDIADVQLPVFINHSTRKWIENCIVLYGKRLGEIQYVFCSDEYLYDLNVRYLNHDTYTDIITFDLSDKADFLSGELYISIERVLENSQLSIQTFENEMNRVIIHGVLHLLGFKDKTKSESDEMRLQEQKCLSLLT
jgi:probable rRNA maturation factor